MTNLIFCAFRDRSDAIVIAHEVIRELGNEAPTATLYYLDEPTPPSADGESLIVSLGGDGTFLKAAHVAHALNAPVLAVNLGRVGFLLDVPSTAIAASVRDAMSNGTVSERLALSVTIEGVDDEVFALNEVVVERSQAGHMVRVRTFVDNQEYLSYSADGVMVATPTGSTGYNFSAGGPVIEPSLKVLTLTPIAPHFTIDRSIVVSERAEIRLVVDDKPALLVADGQTIASLRPGDGVLVRRSDSPVRVVSTRHFDLASRLRQSLREGHA